MLLLKYFIHTKNRVKVLEGSKKHRKFTQIFYEKQEKFLFKK